MKIHKKIFFVLVYLLVAFLCPAIAQNPVVEITVLYNNQPLANVYGSADPADFNSIPDFGQSDQQGRIQFFSVSDPEDYTYKITPADSFECSECPGKDNVTLSFSDLTFSDQLGYYVGTAILTQAAQVATVTAVDQDNNPISGVQVFASSFRSDGSTGGGTGSGASVKSSLFASGTTNSNGQVILAVSPGQWGFNAFKQDGGYSEVFGEVTIPALSAQIDVDDGDPSNIAVVMTMTKADVPVNFSVTEGGEPAVVTQDQFASIYCFSQGDSPYDYLSFFKDIQPGQSTATLFVVGNRDYVCDFYSSENKASSPVSFSAGGNQEPVSAEFKLLAANYELFIKFVDSEGNLIPLSADVFANTLIGSSVQHFANSFEPESTGLYKLSLVEGANYELFVAKKPEDPSGSFSSLNSDDDYILGFQIVQVATDVGTSGKEVSFTAQKSNAAFSIKVLDENGSPVPYAWVDAFHGNFDDQQVAAANADVGKFISFGGITDENGEITLKVLADKTYSLNAWMPYDPNSNALQPAPVDLTPGVDEPLTHTFQPQTPDHTVNITLESPESVNWSYCSAWNELFTSFADIQGTQGTLSAVTQGTELINVVCHGAGTENFYSSDQQVVTDVSSSESNLTVVLKSFGRFYDNVSTSFDPDAAKTIELPDECGKIVASAGAFDTTEVQNSSNPDKVTVTIGTNQDQIPVNDDISPFQVFEITAKDADGEAITSLKKAISITFCIDPTLLPEGFDLTTLTALGETKGGNTGALQLIDGEVDTEANPPTITFSTDHLSDYGVNIAKVETTGSVDAPTSVTAKKKKKSKNRSSKGKSSKNVTVEVKWDAVDGSTGYIVRHSYEDNDGNVTNTEKEVEAKSSGKKKGKKGSKGPKAVFKLKAKKEPGTHSFAVASKDENGNRSSFAAAKGKTIKVKAPKKKKGGKKKNK